MHSTTTASEAQPANIELTTENVAVSVAPTQWPSTTITSHINGDDDEENDANRIDVLHEEDQSRKSSTDRASNADDDDDDNTHSNDLIYESPVTVQRTECAAGEGSCDHGCRMIYANAQDTNGRTECFCSVGFKLDTTDGRTCHGKNSAHFGRMIDLIRDNIHLFNSPAAHVII